MRRVAAETEPPHVVLRPQAEYVPTHELDVESCGRVESRRTAFESRRLEIRSGTQLEILGHDARFEAEAHRDDGLFAGASDGLRHEGLDADRPFDGSGEHHGPRDLNVEAV